MRLRNLFLCLSLLHISLQACNGNKTDQQSELNDDNPVTADVEPGTIAVPKLITSLQVGESEKIELPPPKGPADKRTVTPSRNNVTAKLDSDGNLIITGMSLGVTKVFLDDNDSSDASNDHKATLEVRVYDPMYLDIGDLLIGYTDQFDWAWNDDDKSDDSTDTVTFWTPRTPEGFYYLGEMANPGYDNPSGMRVAVVVKDINNSQMLAKPVRFDWVWDSGSINSYHDGTIYRPIPPDNYVCLGFLAMKGKVASVKPDPETTKLRCVHKSLVGKGSPGGFKWYTQGQKDRKWRFLTLEVVEPNFEVDKNLVYLPTGTFVGGDLNGNAAPDSAFNVLKFKAPIFQEFADEAIRPQLTSTNPPPDSTPYALARVIGIPFTFVRDGEHNDVHWQVTNSPFYWMRTESFYRLVDSLYNDSATTHETKSVAIESGISRETSTTVSHEVGVLVGLEGEVGFLGTGTKAKLEVSYKYGYATTTGSTDYTSKTVTSNLDVPPKSLGAIYQLVNSYQVERNSADDSDKVVGTPFLVPSDHTMVDFYPD